MVRDVCVVKGVRVCERGKRANCEGVIFEVDFTGSEEDATLDGSDIYHHPTVRTCSLFRCLGQRLSNFMLEVRLKKKITKMISEICSLVTRSFQVFFTQFLFPARLNSAEWSNVVEHLISRHHLLGLSALCFPHGRIVRNRTSVGGTHSGCQFSGLSQSHYYEASSRSKGLVNSYDGVYRYHFG